MVCITFFHNDQMHNMRIICKCIATRTSCTFICVRYAIILCFFLSKQMPHLIKCQPAAAAAGNYQALKKIEPSHPSNAQHYERPATGNIDQRFAVASLGCSAAAAQGKYYCSIAPSNKSLNRQLFSSMQSNYSGCS